MKEEGVNTGGSVLLTFLAGAAVGAGIALLLAPKAGRELRKDITDFTGEAKDKVYASIEKGRALFEEGKMAVASAIDAGKEAYIHEKEKVLKAV